MNYNLTKYTINDINYVRIAESDHELTLFKKNLVVELKENYELGWWDIGFLLNERSANLKELYYCFKDPI